MKEKRPIWCARVTFIGYAQAEKIGKPNIEIFATGLQAIN
jgi:hypothetical protein